MSDDESRGSLGPLPDPPSSEHEPGDEIITATWIREPAAPSGLQKAIQESRWLTILLLAIVMGATTTVYLMTSFVSLLTAEWLILGEIPSDPAAQTDAMTRVMRDRLGFFMAILPPQLSLLIAPLAASYLLPEGPRRGLRLVRGRWPIWVWFAAAAGTPLIGMISSIVVSAFTTESESLKSLTEAFRIHGQSGFLIPVALLIGLAPAVCEELVFRGFLQPRLTRLIPPVFGVLLSSLAFAVFHLDPVHVVAVFPLGLWLGFLSYRSGSLFPAILGHFVNNVLSVIGVMAAETGALDAPPAMLAITIVVGGLLGFASVIYASLRWRVEKTAY